MYSILQQLESFNEEQLAFLARDCWKDALLLETILPQIYDLCSVMNQIAKVSNTFQSDIEKAFLVAREKFQQDVQPQEDKSEKVEILAALQKKESLGGDDVLPILEQVMWQPSSADKKAVRKTIHAAAKKLDLIDKIICQINPRYLSQEFYVGFFWHDLAIKAAIQNEVIDWKSARAIDKLHFEVAQELEFIKKNSKYLSQPNISDMVKKEGVTTQVLEQIENDVIDYQKYLGTAQQNAQLLRKKQRVILDYLNILQDKKLEPLDRLVCFEKKFCKTAKILCENRSNIAMRFLQRILRALHLGGRSEGRKLVEDLLKPKLAVKNKFYCFFDRSPSPKTKKEMGVLPASCEEASALQQPSPR